jgi:hypothetical protein
MCLRKSFPDGSDFGMLHGLLEPLQRFEGSVADLIGVNADGGEDPRIALRQARNGRPSLRVDVHLDDGAKPRRESPGQNLRPVGVEGVDVYVSMRIYHLLKPLGCSPTDSVPLDR